MNGYNEGVRDFKFDNDFDYDIDKEDYIMECEKKRSEEDLVIRSYLRRLLSDLIDAKEALLNGESEKCVAMLTTLITDTRTDIEEL